MGKYDEGKSEEFRTLMEGKGFKMVGLNAEWSLLTYLIKEDEKSEYLASDDEMGSFTLARVSKTTRNGNAQGFTISNEEWYQNKENFETLITFEHPNDLLTFIDAGQVG